MFDIEFIEFFKELAINNNKDWFHVQKKRYQKSVKKPMTAFTQNMIDRLSNYEPKWADIQPKHCVFRINNDIRFNPESPLYKLHVGALITEEGRKGMHIPGCYIHLGLDEAFVAGGIYMPQKDQLLSIRKKLIKERERFYQILNGDKFQKVYGGLGESKKNKRLPKDMMQHKEAIPELLNKQFYYMHKFDSNRITSPELADYIEDVFVAGEPMRHFLRDL